MSRRPLSNDKPRAAKAVRIGLRATPQQEALIRRAAARVRKSVTEFILDSTCAVAEQALLEQCYFPVGSKQWKAFQAALDRPPRAKPELTALLKKTKTPWD